MQFADFDKIFPPTRRHLVLLVDPDTFEFDHYADIFKEGGDLFSAIFLGGSHITQGNMAETLGALRSCTSLPVILFPGSPLQLIPGADALLFLSLISGRNSELLIGQHVMAAPRIAELGLAVIPTAYILVNSGPPTTVSYISGTQPIPADKPAIAAATALAGQMLGFKVIYLDGGSGTEMGIPSRCIAAVRAAISLPLITGGGLRSAHHVRQAFEAGADIAVIGNALERDTNLIKELKAGVWQK